MGLKDMLRRIAGRDDDAAPAEDEQLRSRQREDATVVIQTPIEASPPPPEPGSAEAGVAETVVVRSQGAPGADGGDATVMIHSPIADPAPAAEPTAAEDPSGLAGTVMLQSPIADPPPTPARVRQPQDTTEELEAPRFDSSAADPGATVAVPVPSFDEEDRATADPAARGERGAQDATVVMQSPIQDPPAAQAGDVLGATVAVPIPDFDEPSPQPSVGARAEGSAAASTDVTESEPGPSDPEAATPFDTWTADEPGPPVVGVLVGIDGDLAGMVCVIHDGEASIGRSEDCEIVLPSLKISREHATIVHQDGVFAIVPKSERNPTYVNGEVILGCELSDGDSLRFGRTTFRFRSIQGP